MKINRRQLRKLMLAEIKVLTESAYFNDPIADKVNSFLEDDYEVEEVPMLASVNPFDEFDETVINTLKKAGMWELGGRLFYVVCKDPNDASAIATDIDRDTEVYIAPRGSGKFLSRTVFFKGH